MKLSSRLFWLVPLAFLLLADTAKGIDDKEGTSESYGGCRYTICTFIGLNKDGELKVKFKGKTRYYKMNRDSELYHEGKSIQQRDLAALKGIRVNIYHSKKDGPRDVVIAAYFTMQLDNFD